MRSLRQAENKSIYIKDNMSIQKKKKEDNIPKCDQIAQEVFNAICKQDPSSVKKHLALNFSFMGHKFPVAKLVFDAVFREIPGTFSKFKQVKSEISKNNISIVYDFVFTFKEEPKQQTILFQFNKSFKITLIETSMLEISVNSEEANEEESTIEETDTLLLNLSDQKIINIPFILIEEVPFVTATINNEPRTLMFDSGALNLILNSHYFTETNIEEETDKSVKITIEATADEKGKLKEIRNTKVSDFDFYGISFKEQLIKTLDLSHLEKALKIEVHGLIGYDIIKDYDILYDYPNRQITLIQPDETDNFIKVNYSIYNQDEIPFEMIGEIPHIIAKIQSIVLKLGLDTGCSSVSIDEKYFIDLSSFLTADKDNKVAGVRRNKKVKTGKIDQLIISKQTFINVDTIFGGHNRSEESDGVFGFPVLTNTLLLVKYNEEKLVFLNE